MPRAASPKVILTDEDLAERWGLDVQTVRIRRRNGDCPKYLLLTESRTQNTIRYRLADVEAYEESLLVDPKARASA